MIFLARGFPREHIPAFTPYTLYTLHPLHLTLMANRSHTTPTVPIAADPAHAAGIEAHAPCAVRVVRIERTRPVVAAAACIDERTIFA